MVESTTLTTMAAPALSASGTATAAGIGIKLRNGTVIAAPNVHSDPHNCVRSYVSAMAMLQPCVDRVVDVVCLQETPRERAGSRISHAANDFRKGKSVWTAARKGSSLRTNEQSEFSKNAGHDIIVINIKSRGEKMIRIVNIYDQRARET